jgi:chromosome segregation protein
MEQTRLQMEQKRAALDTLRQQYQQTQRQQFDAEKRVAVADTSVQNLQRTLQQLETERTQRAASLEQLATERSQKESTLAERKVDLEQLQQHQDQTKEQILQTQAILDELRNELAEESRKLDAKKNEFALLKSMIDSMEGYPDSVKFLHNNKEWRTQVPILSDVLYVKEEYRKALENVLEPYLSYYVVADLQEGLDAVHLLDKHQKGKANFFLLDQVNAHGQGASSHQLTGAISALSVVEVEEPYRKLAEQLLGNVFIADSEEALSNSNGFVVIEKQGRYVKGKFSLTGGSVGLFEGNKIGRAKNLEKLQLAIDQQQAIVDALRSTIQTRHNEVIAFNEDLREVALRQAEKEIQQLSNELFAIQNKVENLTNTQQSSGAKVTELQGQVEQITASVADVRSEFEQLNAAFSGLQISLQGAENEFRSSELSYNEATRQFNEFNLSITRQQSKISGLVQESSFKNNQLIDLQSQIEQSKLQQTETTDSSTQSREQLTSIEQQLLELLRKKQEDEALLNTADQAYYVLRNELSEKESAIRHQSKEKEQVEFLLAAIKDKLNDLKLQLAGMKERLSVEFRVDLEQILGEARLSETALEELQATAERMKKRLENLGEVNPTAIEAFTEMKKRYDFIVEQKTDLVTAKDSLLKTIEEVEATANQKFLDTFEQVRMHFQKVFKTLFTEDDQCDLVLEDPNNVAESGIDVVAKPKGKRPSSLTQLSGGERTLTATALLFAIYLIKPAPFCILDEVDAPLDDANVGKFTNMIRQFSENSQFIIVTHNKMTMSTVDVIYGVTMQEPGVSKLVTVDFRSLQQN